MNASPSTAAPANSRSDTSSSRRTVKNSASSANGSTYFCQGSGSRARRRGRSRRKRTAASGGADAPAPAKDRPRQRHEYPEQERAAERDRQALRGVPQQTGRVKRRPRRECKQQHSAEDESDSGGAERRDSLAATGAPRAQAASSSVGANSTHAVEAERGQRQLGRLDHERTCVAPASRPGAQSAQELGSPPAEPVHASPGRASRRVSR